MRNYADVLVKPMISEKTIGMIEENKYTFIVAKDANKIEWVVMKANAPT